MPRRRRRTAPRVWIALGLGVALSIGAILWWRRGRAVEPAATRSVPQEEIREGDRRELQELLERRGSRGAD